MTVERMLREMSAREFGEWMEFAGIEPFGCGAEDYRAGVVAACHVNPMREKGSPALKPLDFFPWQQADEPASDDPSMRIKALKDDGRRVILNG